MVASSNLLFEFYLWVSSVFLLTKQEPIAFYRCWMESLDWCSLPLQPPEDALFAHPRLFRACVPPGMHRFRGNIWDYDSRPHVMRTLGYPLTMRDRIPDITEARNIELGLGLQVILYSLLIYICRRSQKHVNV